jgi:DNA-binding CsgD family transcriptional regulator/DNA-binding beta-propeller fold protein YncE
MEGRHVISSTAELTARQREVLALVARGHTNFEIARRLGLSLDGVKYHVSEILGRLGVDSREEAVAAWHAERRPGRRLGQAARALVTGTVARWVAGGAGLALLAVAAAVVALSLSGGDQDRGDGAASPVATAGSTPGGGALPLGRVVATIAVGGQPDSIAAGEGGVWVGNHISRTVARIDPATNRVVATIPIDSRWTQVTTGGGAVWVAAPERATVYRIDPASNRVVATIPLLDGPDPGGIFSLPIAYGAGSLWALDPRGQLSRVDPATNRVVARIPLPGYENLDALVAADDAVWVLEGLNGLIRVDPATNRAGPPSITVPPGPALIARDGDAMWMSWTMLHRVVKLNLLTGALDTSFDAVMPGQLVATADSAWVVLYSRDVVLRIATNTYRDTVLGAIAVGDNPLGIAAGEGAVWVTNINDGTVSRIDPAADGPASTIDILSTPTPPGPVYN